MGVSKVLLPADNKPDLDELPETVRSELSFVLLHTVDDALREALL
jgi:ATP-dependent Lon protease